MSRWNITIRGKDGRLEVITLESESRAAVFSEIGKRGLRPIKVEQSTGKNPRKLHPKANAGKHDQMSNHSKGLVAIVAVAILACAVFVIVFSLQKPPEGGSTEPKKSRKTEEQKAPKPQRLEEVKTEATIPVVKKLDPNRPMTPEERREAALERIAEAQKRNANLPMAHERKESALKTASDQILSMVADIAEGKDMPPLPIDKNFEREFIESLKVPIEIDKDDDERIKALKQNVIALRQELSERAEQGESVSQILREYEKRMAEDYKTRAELQQEARKILDSGDRDGARKFVDVMNLALQQMGIKEIDMPMTAEERKAWADEFLKQREEQAKEREKRKQ